MWRLNALLLPFIWQVFRIMHAISSDTASPTVYYQFCTAATLSGSDFGEERKLTVCEPETFGSNSWFEFGNTSQHVLDLEGRLGTNDFLHLKCNASYPVLWLASAVSMSGVTLDSNEESNGYLRNPLENKTFTYSHRAAEIFLKVAKSLLQPSVIKRLQAFAADMHNGEHVKHPTSLTVPCVSDIDGYENFTMSKLTREKCDNNASHSLNWTTKNLTHVVEYSPENTNYDHRIGFRINEMQDPSFVYLCNSPLRKEIIIPVALSATWVADLHYSNGEEEKAGFYCNIGNENIVHIQVSTISQCQSVLECRFMWAPLQPLWMRQPPNYGNISAEEIFKAYSVAKPGLQGKVPAYNHGFIRCGGRIVRDGGKIYAYKEDDHWFTGLDNLKYMVSKSFPIDSIIRLSSSTEKRATENSLRHFHCEISTFVLLPNIQFAVEYSTGKHLSKLVWLEKTLPPGFRISKLSPDKKRATLAWMLQVQLSVNMTKIICYAPWANSSQWAQTEAILHVTAEADLNLATSGGIIGIGGILGISVAGAAVIILTFSLALLWRKYKFALTQNLTKEEVEEFHLGVKHNGSDENALMENMPFDSEMEIPSASLKIEKTILGEGEYGIVHKGSFRNQTVAVKSPKKTADVDYFRAFLKEIKVMAYIGEHENIVHFFGAVVEKLEERECFAVIEWSSRGNLNFFLRKCIMEADGSSEQECYQNADSSQRRPSKNINQLVLINMCKQIAEGMEFLSQRKVIHGDLATRNVLVFDEYLVKITDFGLSRKLYSCSNYVKKNQAPLPWRWMSLESLRYLEFSTQSDVWSFGVTAWEIFTMAQVPFSGTNWSTEFVDQVESGYRLSKPLLAPQAVFEWMMRCWENNPDQRPAFRDCVEFLTLLPAQLEAAANSSRSKSELLKTESIPPDQEFSSEIFSIVSENLAENI